MGLGTNLKRVLAVRKTSIKELAEQTGIPTPTLYSITRRDSGSTKTEYLTRIAEVLGVGIEELIDPRKVQVIHGPNALEQPQGELFNCTARAATPSDIESIASILTIEGRERLLAYALELAELERLRAKCGE